MVVIGVTGGIGCGKSTVAALLADRGAIVVDADKVARQVTAPGGASHQALVDHFGAAVLGVDGTLDRAAIAARVFSDPDELAALNAITHPAIAAVMLARLAQLANQPSPVVLDIPLLSEAAVECYHLSGVVVVDAPVEVAIRRLVDQRGLTEADAAARIAAQPGRSDRLRLADVVVDNGGTREALEASVSRVWAWLTALPHAAPPHAAPPHGAAPHGSVDGAPEEAPNPDGTEGEQEQH